LEENNETAADHNLLLLVCKRLKELGQVTDGGIREFIEETESLYYKNVARTTRQQVLAEDTVFLLKANEIPSLVFRGSEISSEFYGDLSAGFRRI